MRGAIRFIKLSDVLIAGPPTICRLKVSQRSAVASSANVRAALMSMGGRG